MCSEGTLAVDLVCGGALHPVKSSSQARGVYCQISISHQQPGLKLLELPGTAQSCTGSSAKSMNGGPGSYPSDFF
jgi:hypothetical protein